MKKCTCWTLFILLSLANQGCLELAGSDSSGSATLSSVQGCSDAGLPITSPPNLPTSIETFEKGEEYVFLIDEVCAQSSDRSLFSNRFFSERFTNKKLSRHRAYNWKANASFNLTSLKKQVDSDPCIIQMDKEIDVELFYTSNDEFFDNLRFFETINAELAHDIFYHVTTGISSNVVIAIIDSGVQSDHPDLSGRLWVNGGEIAGNATDDDGNGYVDDVNGYNFASDIGAIDPLSSEHGTHVAGLAAAEANNSEGVAGIMGFNAQIMGLNVSGASGISTADVINAIYYAADNGADVINLSLGGAGRNELYLTAMQYAVTNGVTVVTAAGNDGAQLSDSVFFSPGSFGQEIEGAINVGSLDVSTEAKSSFSNFSSTYVEIMAPGSDAQTGGLLSTVLASSYNYLQGTSMASPVTAGAAALAIGLIESRGGTPTPAQVESYLKSTAERLTSLNQCVEGSYHLDLLSLGQQINTDFP